MSAVVHWRDARHWKLLFAWFVLKHYRFTVKDQIQEYPMSQSGYHILSTKYIYIYIHDISERKSLVCPVYDH